MNNRQVIHALLAILLGAFLLLAGSCRDDSPESGSDGMAGKTVDNAGPIKVVCTTGMIADIVERIGGSQLDVYCMMGPGVDPHLYQATTGDVQALADADIVFYNGLHLEAKLGELLERLGQQRPVVAVTDGIDREKLDKPAQFEGLYDPHVWMDVELWTSAAETVRNRLQELRPDLHDEFEGNWMDLWTDLDVLQLAVTEALGTVPEESRVLITAHDAFNYFGKAYGFEVRGLQGISTQAEAGTADVRELAEFIVERRIPAIFVESSVPQRNIEAVQAACSSRGFEVQIGGELYSDAMGTAGTPDGTYDGMIRHNVMTIVQALGGTIPYSISDENGNPLWERPAWTE